MAILWRYLLRSYFQVFLLSISGFVALLLVVRFSDIASFATTGAGWGTVGMFTLYQIPYILPLAIPISCLIASILLLQRLSHTHELTACRASGLGLKTILFPLFAAGLLLTLVNFTILSELGPACKARAKRLVYEMAMRNPLALFQKDSPIKLKDAYVDIKTLRSGQYAEDLVLILKNLSNERLGLMTAKELWIEGDSLMGKEVAFISSLDPKQEDAFDHLIIENQATMSTMASYLSQLIQNADLQLHYDYLPLRLILAKRFLSQKFTFGHVEEELSRRFTLALAALSFTIIGVAFGVEIGRNRNNRGLFWAIGLAAFFMVCYVGAKSFRHAPIPTVCLYLLPHPIILLFSIFAFKRAARGIE
jgi:lipopolysaccharide export system permease protein